MADDPEKPGLVPLSNAADRASTHSSESPTATAPADKPTSIIVPETTAAADPFAHLPPHEAAVLRCQVDTPNVVANMKTLYRYSSRNDILIVIVSALCAIASGAALPLMTVLFGSLQGVFSDYFSGLLTHDPDAMTYGQFKSKLSHFVLYFVYLGIGEFITTYIATVGFIYTGEHVSAKVREQYLASCMRQNIGYFDKLGAGEVTTRITADTNLIQEGISEKIGLTLTAFAVFVSAFVIGFIKYWKLTLILFSTVVALVLNMGIGSRFIVKFSKASLDSYAQGGSVAEEVLGSVRNAIAFSTQDRLARKYDTHLATAEKFGWKLKAVLAVMIAGMMLILYLNYGLSFWVGSKFIVDGTVPLSDVLTIMMAIMIGAFNIGNVAPNFQAFTTAVAAAAKIFSTIDRQSPLDSSSDAGARLDSIEGTITLEDIKHIYPSRPTVTVMDGVSLTIPAGKTTALVGASGSGKSTIVGLVERFYNPVHGRVLLDGHDISTLNLRWLRQQMALVQQEPTLFGTTIYENIRYGLIGTQWEAADAQKQKELVEAAAKKANAHDFITALPEGYQTNVGDRGFLLSGGQKQRIAISRAVVSDPKILLLDEATSALDTKSEGVVQAALEAAASGRTTITIAHRLSTIKDAHNIVVMSAGRIIEQGTHDELLERQGAYFKLVAAQQIGAAPNANVEAKEEAELAEIEMQITRELTHKATEDGTALATAKSASSAIVAGKSVKEAEVEYSTWTLVKLIASFNRNEWPLMLAGLFFSIICGGGNPTMAVLFAKQITTLSTPITPENKHHIKHTSDFYSSMFLMLAFVMWLAFSGQGILFAKCSERLVHRVRDRAFRSMLRQDVAFFDRDENTAGALTSFLSTETTHVAGLSGVTLGTLFMMSTTLVAALVLSISIGWKLSLVCTATIPLLLACGYFRFSMLAHFQRRSKAAYTASASYASEAIGAIRTVAALTREDDVLAQYRASLAEQQRRSLNSVLKSSILYAASQSLVFLCFALGFWYGGTLIGKLEYGMFQFFVCFSAIIFGAQSAGSVFSFAPDMGKAHQAAAELKTLFDRQPSIDSWGTDGETVGSVDGHIEFRDVHFRYPTRLEQPVLRGLNLSVKPGQYVALVGASGCGKSTTIALLERFYDPLAGAVLVDGRDVSKLNVAQYRSQIALVSQEPTLYQGTMRENIVLGSERSDVTDEEVAHACREANIYDFIMSLPDGFATNVGNKGTLLSGGQKQRVAIARALIRDPKILLLDEATSALDSESEHVVQAALDKAAKGRTTIAVAHRLSTIQKADMIFVFDQGRVVEQGTHGELMKRNGRYAELVNLQSLEKTG
ncbi:hypothetical protein TD95_003615 [Thielaviopsis punctulata]|uniref:Leptomycin B resistance protein pmd1 n=1 Tax=Thielaviopsis punctulata TaxID=72032 RepID=A0A0F4ZCW5_9PEZI|nr:hypothetical protein TD95_003615 [Thielaviopsis punctulata]